MKNIVLILALGGALISCSSSDSASAASPECPEYVEITLGASDVYGTGAYTKYRAQFEEKTGCSSMLACSDKSAVITIALDDYRGVKWCQYW